MNNTRTCPACRFSYPLTNVNLADGMPNVRPNIWWVEGKNISSGYVETMPLIACPNCGVIRIRLEDE